MPESKSGALTAWLHPYINAHLLRNEDYNPKKGICQPIFRIIRNCYFFLFCLWELCAKPVAFYER